MYTQVEEANQMNIRPLTQHSYEQLLAVSRRQAPATVWFKNVHFLNVYTGGVERAHIYTAGERIAYVGEQEPLVDAKTDIVELEEEQLLVPGYIEPHAHPFQWYNPLTLGEYFIKQGTTVSINDNMFLFMKLNDDEAVQFIEELDKKGNHLWLWWSRFDGQTAASYQEARFNDESLKKWLSHRLVVQGGEFTSWPLLLKGNKDLARWMNMTRQQFGKRIEGHLPGASVETLNTLTAAGVGADHESLNGEDVLKRLRLGLYATLRYSSIRPDLPHLLKDIRELEGINTSRLMLTNDGSMPFFIDESGCNRMLQIVMEHGFSAVDAYRMVTLNPATYYGLDQDIGGIAPGRLAHFNVLNHLQEPTPVHVMVDGRWVVKNSHHVQEAATEWLNDYFPKLQQTITITESDLQHSHGNMGISLMNEVITKPYAFDPHSALQNDEHYISLVNSKGEWVLNSRLKAYANSGLQTLVSTYTASKDYILIGKNQNEMMKDLSEILSIGGGIKATFADETSIIIPLPLNGGMSNEHISAVIQHSERFVKKMKQNGFVFSDPIYSLLFLTATHLPFIRLTSEGVYLIKEQEVVAPVHKLNI